MNDVLILAGVAALLAVTCALAVIPAEILHRRRMKKLDAFGDWMAQNREWLHSECDNSDSEKPAP